MKHATKASFKLLPVLLLAPLLAPLADAAPGKPNIIFIYADG